MKYKNTRMTDCFSISQIGLVQMGEANRQNGNQRERKEKGKGVSSYVLGMSSVAEALTAQYCWPTFSELGPP